jgi:LysM repeat protein
VVQAGETLFSISQLHGLTVAELQLWNQLGDSTAIQVGQQLVIIPTADLPHTVEPTVNFHLNHGSALSADRFTAIHRSQLPAEGQEVDIVLWADVPLQDLRIHRGVQSSSEAELVAAQEVIGDIAVGEAFHLTSLTQYQLAFNFSILSILNSNGEREFFTVSDMTGPGADQLGIRRFVPGE